MEREKPHGLGFALFSGVTGCTQNIMKGFWIDGHFRYGVKIDKGEKTSVTKWSWNFDGLKAPNQCFTMVSDRLKIMEGMTSDLFADKSNTFSNQTSVNAVT